MAKKYISKYTGPEIDSGLDNIPKLEGKLTELESEVVFFSSKTTTAQAYESGLYDIYIDRDILPVENIKMWNYRNSTGTNLLQVYAGSIGLLVNYNLANAENNKIIELKNGNEVVGYIVLKDKQKFIDYPLNNGIAVNVQAATSNERHSYLWAYKELKQDIETYRTNNDDKVKSIEDDVNENTQSIAFIDKKTSAIELVTDSNVGKIYHVENVSAYTPILADTTLKKGELLTNLGVPIIIGESIVSGNIVGQKNIGTNEVLLLKKDYTHIQTRGEVGNVMLSVGTALPSKVYKLESQLRFYTSSSATIPSAYERGLLDIYMTIAPTTIELWCYNSAIYLRYKESAESDYITIWNGFATSEIENYQPLKLEVDGSIIGYIVFKDIALFADNPSGTSYGLNVESVTSKMGHSYLWLYDGLVHLQNEVSENADFVKQNRNVDLSLPDTIYAVVGDTLQLFYRGIVKAVNPYNYDILVTCAKGNQYPRYYEFTPTSADVGSIPFKITVKDNNRNIIAEKSCTIKVVNVASSPSSVKKVACFGDSLTAPGTWVAEAYRRLTSTGGTPSANGLANIDFVGAKTKDGAGYFGVGGWTWSSYTTKGVSAYRFIVSNVTSLSVGAKYTHNGNTFTIMEVNVTGGNGNVLCSVDSLTPAPSASGTLSKSSGSGDDSISFSSYSQDSANPLWDYNNNKMTFIPYAEKYADGKLDIVYTLLSWNGISAGMTDFSSIISKVRTFADTLHSEFPNAKLKIMGLQIPSVNGGMGANYGATGTSYADGYGMVVTAMNMNKAYQDFANEDGYSEFVEFVNVSSQFDSESNMPYANTKVNTRSSLTEKRGNNGVHPSTEGYMQIADIVYRNLMADLSYKKSITYTRAADGTSRELTPKLVAGQTIVSITGVGYLSLYDEAENKVNIGTSELPYLVTKTYVKWAAYASGAPQCTMIVQSM